MELVDGGKKNFGQRFVQDDSWKYIFPFAGTCNKKSHNVKKELGGYLCVYSVLEIPIPMDTMPVPY